MCDPKGAKGSAALPLRPTEPAHAQEHAEEPAQRAAEARLLAGLRCRLGAREREVMALPGFRQAAVLVPLLRTPAGLEVLFSVRSRGLANHAGQIAFPGGRLDPGETVAAAARRETFEEIGVSVPEEALLGTLHDHPSPAGYVVTPIVGVLPWPQPLTLSAAEVDEVFSVPLSELRALTPRYETRTLKIASLETSSSQNVSRVIPFYTWRRRLIWGMTGNVLKDLLDTLREVEAGAVRR